MDTFAQVPTERRTTQAAEGLPRWRWTTEELVRLKQLGVFGDMDRFELFDGEIVPMSPVGRRHVMIADRIGERWVIVDPANLRVGEEKQVNLTDTSYVKPDILVWPTSMKVPDVRGPDVLLVVEVAESSLTKDRVFKRRVYAAYGVREYWVIEAETLTTRVHTDLANGDYMTVKDLPATVQLVPTLAPSLAIRLADLDV